MSFMWIEKYNETITIRNTNDDLKWPKMSNILREKK